MRRSNKFLAPLIAFVLWGASFAARADDGASTHAVVVDRIAAVVDGDIITWRELQEKAQPFLQNVPDTVTGEARHKKEDALMRQVLDIEIGERMVTKEVEAQRDKLGVTDKDVDRAIQEVLRMNNLNDAQLQSALYGQGMTMREYRGKLREQIERARLVNMRVQGKIQIKDQDVVRRCQERQRLGDSHPEVCAAHVLLKIPPHAEPTKIQSLHAQASRLRSELQAGADFAAYAMKYSDDRAAPDGQVGCFHRGEMMDAFEDAAFALQPNEISQVVQTPVGFHIIKVLERRASKVSGCDSPDELEPFRGELHQEEMQRQMQLWVEELRTKAFVEVRL